MRINTLSLAAALALLPAVGCDSKPAAEPTPATPAAAPVAATPAPAKPAETKVASAEPAHADDAEEGCVYKDAAKPHAEEGCPSPDLAAPTTPGHYGSVFALKETKPLSTVLASAKDGLKDPVQVSGQVDSVCQKKGCWLVVKDGEAQARVLMKDHAFTIPMDTKGKPVVVEGTLEARTFNEAQVKHLEKDAGKDPATISGERTEYVLTATAVELKNS